MTVKMNIEVELEGFDIPESVPVVNDVRVMLLSELPWEILNKLCDNFRSSVFKSAGKQDSKGG